MYRGRGSYNRTNESFGSNSRRTNDFWYGPQGGGNRNDNSGYRNQGHGTNYDTRSRHGVGKKECSAMICKHYALYDNCRFGTKCSFLHSLKRVVNMSDIIRGGVCCAVVSKLDDKSLDLFACGHGPSIKRWKLYGDGGDIQVSNGPNINIPIQDDGYSGNTRGRGRGRGYGADQCIYSLHCVDDCLFVGLKSGSICVYHIPTGNSTNLNGHTSPVSCITVIEGVVLSVCESGKINLWKFDSGTGAFNCVNSLLTRTRVNCLLEILTESVSPNIPNQMAQTAASRVLWAGGSVINIIDLNTLLIAKTIQLPNNVYANSFVRYGNHVITGLSNGLIKIYSYLGDEVYSAEGDNPSLTSMDGMEALNGDLLLLGSKSGQITAVQLPSFNLEAILPCHSEGHKNAPRGGITHISSLGPKHFLTTGHDGNISIFMWNII